MLPSPTQSPVVTAVAHPTRTTDETVGWGAPLITPPIPRRGALGPVLPRLSVTAPAAMRRFTWPAPLPAIVTVYGPAPDPVTDCTLQSVAPPTMLKSAASKPLTHWLNDTVKAMAPAVPVARPVRMAVTVGRGSTRVTVHGLAPTVTVAGVMAVSSPVAELRVYCDTSEVA